MEIRRRRHPEKKRKVCEFGTEGVPRKGKVSKKKLYRCFEIGSEHPAEKKIRFFEIEKGKVSILKKWGSIGADGPAHAVDNGFDFNRNPNTCDTVIWWFQDSPPQAIFFETLPF